MNKPTLEKAYDLISQVSFALRMSNSYSSEARPYVEDDKKWLSQASGLLELVGQALEKPHESNTIFDQTIQSFSEYLNPSTVEQPPAMDSFQRWEIDIDEAIVIIQSLKNSSDES